MEFRDTLMLRHSTRSYLDQCVKQEDLLAILDAGRLAPSGKNSQNWHFVVIRNRMLQEKIAQVILDKNEKIAIAVDQKDPEKGTRFRKFIRNTNLFYLNAPVLMLVYATLYVPSGYQELSLIDAPAEELERLLLRSPSLQGVGAAVENMSLAAVDLGYGTCWMTSQNFAGQEIQDLLKQEVGFEKDHYFLACMLSLGVPDKDQRSPLKKPLEEVCTFID